MPEVESPPASPPGTGDPSASPPNTPVRFAGKYDTPEALIKGHEELSKKLEIPIGTYKDITEREADYVAKEKLLGKLGPKPSQSPPAKPSEPLSIKPVETPAPQAPTISDDDDIPAIVTKAGLKGDDLADTWAKDGKLTDEQYGKLKAVGVTKQMVNHHMALEMEAVARIRTDAATMVGGEQQLETLLGWARVRENIDPVLREDIGRRLQSRTLYKSALTELQTLYAQKNGHSGSAPLINGQGPVSTGPVKDAAELRELMRREAAGDESARKRILATPDDVIAAWSHI